jgi:hypothetical protein
MGTNADSPDDEKVAVGAGFPAKRARMNSIREVVLDGSGR